MRKISTRFEPEVSTDVDSPAGISIQNQSSAPNEGEGILKIFGDERDHVNDYAGKECGEWSERSDLPGSSHLINRLQFEVYMKMFILFLELILL